MRNYGERPPFVLVQLAELGFCKRGEAKTSRRAVDAAGRIGKNRRMLTAAQRRELDEVGFVRVRAFTTHEATTMQRAIWDQMSRVHGVRQDDVATWPAGAAFGLQGIRERPTFAPIGGERLREALDTLLGDGAWDVPNRWGAFLVTFPRERGTWTVPDRVWHADFPFDLPPDPLPGVKMFALISDVAPRMGGTLVVAGSHRGRTNRRWRRAGFARRYPADAAGAARERSVASRADVAGGSGGSRGPLHGVVRDDRRHGGASRRADGPGG